MALDRPWPPSGLQAKGLRAKLPLSACELLGGSPYQHPACLDPLSFVAVPPHPTFLSLLSCSRKFGERSVAEPARSHPAGGGRSVHHRAYRPGLPALRMLLWPGWEGLAQRPSGLVRERDPPWAGRLGPQLPKSPGLYEIGSLPKSVSERPVKIQNAKCPSVWFQEGIRWGLALV